jgi:hypothetical protein
VPGSHHHHLHQEFHAKFITRPIDYNGHMEVPDDLSQQQEQQQLSPCRSPGQQQQTVAEPLSPALPSFLDTYTPSILTTIEQRPFGAEAEFRRSRLQKQECEPPHYTPLNIR